MDRRLDSTQERRRRFTGSTARADFMSWRCGETQSNFTYIVTTTMQYDRELQR